MAIFSFLLRRGKSGVSAGRGPVSHGEAEVKAWLRGESSAALETAIQKQELAPRKTRTTRATLETTSPRAFEVGYRLHHEALSLTLLADLPASPVSRTSSIELPTVKRPTPFVDLYRNDAASSSQDNLVSADLENVATVPSLPPNEEVVFEASAEAEQANAPSTSPSSCSDEDESCPLGTTVEDLIDLYHTDELNDGPITAAPIVGAQATRAGVVDPPQNEKDLLAPEHELTDSSPVNQEVAEDEEKVTTDGGNEQRSEVEFPIHSSRIPLDSDAAEPYLRILRRFLSLPASTSPGEIVRILSDNPEIIRQAVLARVSDPGQYNLETNITSEDGLKFCGHAVNAIFTLAFDTDHRSRGLGRYLADCDKVMQADCNPDAFSKVDGLRKNLRRNRQRDGLLTFAQRERLLRHLDHDLLKKIPDQSVIVKAGRAEHFIRLVEVGHFRREHEILQAQYALARAMDVPFPLAPDERLRQWRADAAPSPLSSHMSTVSESEDADQLRER